MPNLLNTKIDNRTKFIVYMLFVYIIFQVVMRTSFFLYSSETVSLSLFDVLKTFALGTFFDLVTGLQALLPVFLLLLLIPSKWMKKKSFNKLMTAIIFGIYFFMLFIGISEYLFWEEFQTNFNFIAVDYLIYTTEVLGNIHESYNIWLIIPALLFGASGLTYWQNKNTSYPFQALSIKNKILGMLMVFLIPILIFNIVDSSWRNYASDNKYNVEIAGNGPYEFVSAFNNNELDYDKFYIKQDEKKSFSDLRALLTTKDSKFIDNDSLTRYINNNRPLRTPNIVMIVVESLSADFMARFGNKNSLTPNLDALAKESLLFTKAYATGTRTVRGLEALSLCVPPTPGQSILRRPENEDMFLFGNVLKKHGYTSNFLYGGYGYFDNMNAFYQNNGYNVVDRTDIPSNEIYFETVWGVADEIIFDQAIKQMDKNFSQKQKTFQLIVTTSNHRPFTYPDERIDIPVGTRLGAVKYTDWAIGDFIKKVKNKDWFDNTLFIIVADHQANSAGSVSLPVSKYHIPCMVYAPSFVAPAENNRLISQIDIPPTILGMLGFSYDSRFMGYDINTLEEGRERAFISTYQNLGYIKEDKLVILKPHNKVESFKINDFATSDYLAIDKDDALVEEAIAWYQGTNYLYKNNLLKDI